MQDGCVKKASKKQGKSTTDFTDMKAVSQTLKKQIRVDNASDIYIIFR